MILEEYTENSSVLESTINDLSQKEILKTKPNVNEPDPLSFLSDVTDYVKPFEDGQPIQKKQKIENGVLWSREDPILPQVTYSIDNVFRLPKKSDDPKYPFIHSYHINLFDKGDIIYKATKFSVSNKRENIQFIYLPDRFLIAEGKYFVKFKNFDELNQNSKNHHIVLVENGVTPKIQSITIDFLRKGFELDLITLRDKLEKKCSSFIILKFRFDQKNGGEMETSSLPFAIRGHQSVTKKAFLKLNKWFH